MVLLATAGLTRTQAVSLTGTDIEVSRATVAIGDVAIPTSDDDPLCCARCAVTRWLRTVQLTHLWGRSTIRAALMGETDKPQDHDCAIPVHDGWVHAWPYLPAIDQYGWLTDWRTLSTRAVSAITAYRQAATTALLSESTPVDDDDDTYGLLRAAQPSKWRHTPITELLTRLDEQTDAAEEVLRRVEAAVRQSQK